MSVFDVSADTLLGLRFCDLFINESDYSCVYAAMSQSQYFNMRATYRSLRWFLKTTNRRVKSL